MEEIEEFEETIEEPEEEPEPEPSEPIELAMPVYTAEELLQKAHAAGDDPKVIEDPATGITILDYSDILKLFRAMRTKRKERESCLHE